MSEICRSVIVACWPASVSTRRTGVLALKLGVVPQWTKTGQKFYTTMFQVSVSVLTFSSVFLTFTLGLLLLY